MSRLSLPVGSEVAGAEDALLTAVRATAAPDYEVLGEIARSARDGSVLFLARAASDRGLVALRLSRAGADQEFQLELVRQLDPTLPSPSGDCPRCGARFVAWARFCGKCGSALFGDAGKPESRHAREELRAAVDDAAAGRYEILGEMRHAEGPGVVYFARDLATGRIEALRVQPEGAEEFSIGKTNVMRRLSVSIQAARRPTPGAPPPQPARPAPPSRPAPPPSGPPTPATPALRSGVVPPARPEPPARSPLAQAPARPEPAPRRKSIHIPVPDVPDLPPAVWVLIGVIVLILILVLLT
jgi:hypothetical protein